MNDTGTQSDNPHLHTLLIVDDDAEWTELLATYFLGKYHVRVANLAADAIEIVRKEKPSLIIVDLVMPAIDGFGVIHRLNDASEARIPTILLTGWNTAEVEECAASVGCTTVLGKPISLHALDRIVSSIVSKAALATTTIN
jgi:CheY-like chemotaxis protein